MRTTNGMQSKRFTLRMARAVVDGFYMGLATAGRYQPLSHPSVHGLEVFRDVAYDSHPRAHRLDIYRPKNASGPLPVVLYAHGGAFRMMSKESHWLLATIFARRGYLVYNINYRLAPRHRFPAALEDTCRAYRFLLEDAPRRGGDPGSVILAGESAGANLVTALSIASCWRRDEPWARAVWDLGVVPRAVVPACGILQVSEANRFGGKRWPEFIVDYIASVSEGYLGDPLARHTVETQLADPLVVLERAGAPERPLPAFFAPCGTLDPVVDDTRRLHAALTRLGAKTEARYYDWGTHAFHTLVFLGIARRCWRDTFDFLKRHAH
jgi:acetyl esterase